MIQGTEFPLISVIIPVFNHSRYIESCLESIKKDGWPRLELLVLDDGSSDCSFDVVKKWVDRNSHYFQGIFLGTQENLGITKTLNKLINMCHGEFLVLLASDDFLLEGSITARYKFLTENIDYFAVFTDAIGVDNNGKIIFDSVIRDKFHGNVAALMNKNKMGIELILNWCVPGPVYMARRETYEVLGLYDETSFIEDRYFYLKLISENKLGYLDRRLAAYRLHPASSTGNKTKQVYVGQEIIRIERGLLKFFSGVYRVALQIQIWSNFSQAYNLKPYPKIFIYARCILARSVRYLLRRIMT